MLSYCDLGSAFDYDYHFPNRRRYRWLALGFHRRRRRFFLCLFVHSGDGVHGTHIGWTVSLVINLDHGAYAGADLGLSRVSEFAPKPAQKFLSYLVGWLCFTGWQAAITSICYLTGTIIQGLIILNDVNYVPTPWQGTLLIIAIAAFAIIFNTALAKKLPLVEAFLLFLHVLGLFAIIIVLWTLAPTASAHDVWLDFANGGNWNSNGTATMVGLLSPVISTIGFDCAVHMCMIHVLISKFWDVRTLT